MSVTYTVKPTSGDSTAAVYSSSSMSSSSKIGSLSSGTTVTILSEGSNYYQIKYTKGTTGSSENTGTVKVNSVLNTRSGPGTSYSKVGSLKNGAKVTILETKSGWYKINKLSGNGSGTQSGVWVSASYIITSSSTNNAYISKTDVKSSSSTTTTTSTDDWKDSDATLRMSVDTNFNTSYSADATARYSAKDDYYKEQLMKMNYCFGAPPKYNMDIDIQYISDIGLGRVITETYYASPTILSICPGKVKMFPHLFNSSKRDQAWNALYSIASGVQDIKEKFDADKDNDIFNGALYEFNQDTADYAKRVNLLCRSCAILLGIGEEKMPYTSTPLKSFDYTYWSIRKKYSPTTGKTSTVFSDFWTGGIEAISSGMTDSNYVHFLVSNENTSVNENISTSVESSFLESIFSTTNSVASQLSYFAGIGFNDQMDAQEKVQDILNGIVGENGWTKLIDNTLSGGKLKIPKIVGDTDFSQSVSLTLNFMSPYGNAKSVFLWCIVPVCHLLAFALPKQLSDSMFSYPYILKVFQKGWFNSNLAVITNMSVTRGGNDNTSWSNSGLATEWSVNFEITPLYSQLTLPSTDHPLLFMRNDGLVDYLGNMCGFDLKDTNLDVKANLLTAFVQNKFTGIPNDIQRWISDKVSNPLSKIFHMG